MKILNDIKGLRLGQQESISTSPKNQAAAGVCLGKLTAVARKNQSPLFLTLCIGIWEKDPSVGALVPGSIRRQHQKAAVIAALNHYLCCISFLFFSSTQRAGAGELPGLGQTPRQPEHVP